MIYKHCVRLSLRTQHYLHTKMYIKLDLMGFIYYYNKLINTHF